MDATSPRFGWLSPELQEYLQLICEGVAELVGFKAVLVSVADGDDMIRVAYTGPDVYRADSNEAIARADVIGTRRPRTIAADIVAVGEDWGQFRWVVGESFPEGSQRHNYKLRTSATTSTPGEWRDGDGLVAPLTDADGNLRGLLSVDGPTDGMVPSPEKLAVLEKYADLVSRSILAAYERHELEERARLATEMRRLVRTAAQNRSLDAVLEEIAEPLSETFGLHSMWTRVFIGRSPEFSRQRNGDPAMLPPAGLLDDAEMVASRLWRRQIAGVVALDHVIGFPQSPLTPPTRAYLDGVGAESMLIVPLGAGPDCFGLLVMLRPSGADPWSAAEIEESAEIGRDLGRVLATAHAFEEEGRLAEELRATAHLRSMLLATVSHEIRNPLSAALIGVQLARSEQAEQDRTAALANAERALERLEKVVGDLQLSAKLDATEEHLDAVRVDLAAITREIHRMYRPLAGDADVSLELDVPDHEVAISGDAEQLSRAVSNLIVNALTYTDAGGHVRASLRCDDATATLRVSDDGIGISAADQEHIFDNFYRSTDPQVRRARGTGLGLALTRRIVTAHHGTITVDSTLGEGSTFTVELPIGFDRDDEDPPVR